MCAAPGGDDNDVGLHDEVAALVEHDVHGRGEDLAGGFRAHVAVERKGDVAHGRLVPRRRRLGHAEDAVHQLLGTPLLGRLEILVECHEPRRRSHSFPSLRRHPSPLPRNAQRILHGSLPRRRCHRRTPNARGIRTGRSRGPAIRQSGGPSYGARLTAHGSGLAASARLKARPTEIAERHPLPTGRRSRHLCSPARLKPGAATVLPSARTGGRGCRAASVGCDRRKGTRNASRPASAGRGDGGACPSSTPRPGPSDAKPAPAFLSPGQARGATSSADRPKVPPSLLTRPAEAGRCDWHLDTDRPRPPG